MRNSIAHSMSWAFVGLPFMFASIAACGSTAQERLEPVATVVETAPDTAYAFATWMKLADVVPVEAGAIDVCVRLIVIDGDVRLAEPHRATLNQLTAGGGRQPRDRARPGGN
jgi:hypothetical protein